MNNIYSIPCVFNLITGYYCPGCGITRMFISIYKLDFYQATVNNILLGFSNNPQILTIYRICQGLNISIDEFFKDDLFLDIEDE